MKAINHRGRYITLELSTMEAAIITQALHRYDTKESLEMADAIIAQTITENKGV